VSKNVLNRVQRRLSAAAIAVAIVLGVVTLSAADGLRIVPLVRGGTVLISFSMADGYTEDVRAAIRAGLKTSFTYTVDLRVAAPLWLDQTIASAVVSTSVQYDNLTRRHTIVQTQDGRVEHSEVTENEATVRQLVTTVDRLELFKSIPLEPNREYYVRVRAEIRPRNGTFMWPWGTGRSAQAKFTFLP
jgi:hypothetical protein